MTNRFALIAALIAGGGIARATPKPPTPAAFANPVQKPLLEGKHELAESIGKQYGAAYWGRVQSSLNTLMRTKPSSTQQRAQLMASITTDSNVLWKSGAIKTPEAGNCAFVSFTSMFELATGSLVTPTTYANRGLTTLEMVQALQSAGVLKGVYANEMTYPQVQTLLQQKLIDGQMAQLGINGQGMGHAIVAVKLGKTVMVIDNQKNAGMMSFSDWSAKYNSNPALPPAMYQALVTKLKVADPKSALPDHES